MAENPSTRGLSIAPVANCRLISALDAATLWLEDKPGDARTS
jgi:hypothetical protein